jgi:hypothetical protein
MLLTAMLRGRGGIGVGVPPSRVFVTCAYPTRQTVQPYWTRRNGYASVYGMTTTTHIPADNIQNVWVAADTTWPVDYSLETAHQSVAVIKLHDLTGCSLAVFDGGRWEHVDGFSPDSIAGALSLVPAVVAKYFA